MVTKLISPGACLCTITLFALSLLFPKAGVTSDEGGDEIAFQIVSDQVEYRAGESATIRLILIDRASAPLHISRMGLGTCGKFSGYADLQLTDSEGRNLTMPGCDMTELPVPDDKIKERLMNSNAWVTLSRGEIYGSEVSIPLPSQEGRYRLTGKIHPPSFPGHQDELLKAEHINVLQSMHSANPVAILVK